LPPVGKLRRVTDSDDCKCGSAASVNSNVLRLRSDNRRKVYRKRSGVAVDAAHGVVYHAAIPKSVMLRRGGKGVGGGCCSAYVCPRRAVGRGLPLIRWRRVAVGGNGKGNVITCVYRSVYRMRRDARRGAYRKHGGGAGNIALDGVAGKAAIQVAVHRGGYGVERERGGCRAGDVSPRRTVGRRLPTAGRRRVAVGDGGKGGILSGVHRRVRRLRGEDGREEYRNCPKNKSALPMPSSFAIL